MVPFPRSKEEVVQEFRIQSIQEATMRVIARKGMAAATMQDIADEAGVAKGTIYLYFKDRDELVEKTFDAALPQLLTRIDAVLDSDAPFEEKIRTVFAVQISFFSANREFFRLYTSLRNPAGVSRHRQSVGECHPHYTARVEKLARLVQAAMERGEIRPMDPYRLALFIIEGSTAVVLQRLSEQESPAEEADVEFIAGLILDGVRKRSGS